MKLFIICIGLVLITVNSFAQPHLVMATVSGGQINNYTHAQADYNLHPGDTLGCPNTVTSTISIGNITGKIDSPIYIINIGKITLNAGAIFFKNFKYVKILFRDPTDKYGVLINNCPFRAINTDSVWIGNTFKGVDIHGNADFFMFTTHTRYWTGNIDDANHDNLWDSFRVVNSSGGWFGGNPSDSIGFWVRDTVSNFRVDSLNATTFLAANDWYKLVMYNSNFTNTALGDSTDSGIIDIHGSCNVYNNFVYNYSGSLVRWHGVSLVANKNQSEDTSLIYNNVCRIARKYGGVQVNTLFGDTTFSWIRPGSIIVANNSMSKFYDRSYWVGPPAGGGGVVEDHYWCFGKTDQCWYNAYDSMHYDHGQNVAVNYLIHDGTGQPYPDTSKLNVRVISPIVTYSDTVHLVPFYTGVLSNNALGLSFAPLAINSIPRALGKIVFVGAYNYLINTFWIFRHPAVFKSN